MTLNGTLWCERGMSVSVREPSGVIKTIHIDKPFARIGSDYRSDVVLEEGDIPSRAVYLHATNDGVYFRRLVPRGTSPPPSSGWLSADQFIEVGNYQVAASLQGEAVDDNGSAPLLHRCSCAADEAPRIKIQRVGLKGPAVEHRCRRPFAIVGRSKPSAIRLRRPLVSRCHCVLYFDQGELWAIDLLSANGTLLDGRPIDWRRVRPGQVLQLGEVQITYLGVGSASQVTVRPKVEGAALPGDSSHRCLDIDRSHKPAAEDDSSAAPSAGEEALVGSETAAHDSDAEMDSDEFSNVAIEMSLYALEEQSASGLTISGAPHSAIFRDVEPPREEASGKTRAELAARLQQLERQRDELLDHVNAISAQLQEVTKQDQSHVINAGEWHDSMASAQQQIRDLQSSLETVRRASQLEADRLRKRCRKLKRRIQVKGRNVAPAALAKDRAKKVPAAVSVPARAMAGPVRPSFSEPSAPVLPGRNPHHSTTTGEAHEFPAVAARVGKVPSEALDDSGSLTRLIVNHAERKTAARRHNLLMIVLAGSVAALTMVTAAAWFLQGSLLSLLPGS